MGRYKALVCTWSFTPLLLGLFPRLVRRLLQKNVDILWVGVLLAEVILQWHAWAIWGLSRNVFVYLVITDVVIVTLSFLGLCRSFDGFQFVPSPLPSIRSCVPENRFSGNAIYLNYVCLMVAEINVLVLLLWRGYVERCEGGIALVHILYRDGMVYIFCLLAVSGANLMFYTVQDESMYWMLLPEAQRIGHAILAARLVLNVRWCAQRRQEDKLGFENEDVIRQVGS